MAEVGDTVRYLNAVGGGRIAKIEGKIAYVDEPDGFTTPVLLKECAVVFDTDGEIRGKYRKMHIPDDPGFYEKFYFTPGDLGFEPIETSVGRLGVLVCWDQWYPEAARLMAMRGAEIHPASSISRFASSRSYSVTASSLYHGILSHTLYAAVP